MLNIGPAEVLVIALIALIVVGPEQLPGVLRKIGKSAGQLRQMADGLKKDFMSGMEELDPNTWTEQKPRGKGTVTDPIIGPGAYGGAPDTPSNTSSEGEGDPTGQVPDEKAPGDEEPVQDDQPVNEPVNEPTIAPDEPALTERSDLVDLDEGDRPQ